MLWAAATGILAIIPFGAPLAFGAAAALLAVQGATIAAIAILVWGAVILFIADHFVRPAMIGNATQLPFIAVLLGILGGVETLGLIGLFVGPVVMTLFVTLWHEERRFREAKPLDPHVT
jgi:predicted PurR-regulated permease PerM